MRAWNAIIVSNCWGANSPRGLWIHSWNVEIGFFQCPAEFSPFFGIEKGAVLQEARVFNDPQLDARRCAQVSVSNPELVLFICHTFMLLCRKDPVWFVTYFFRLAWSQVITKLLYLLNQGEIFTKVSEGLRTSGHQKLGSSSISLRVAEIRVDRDCCLIVIPSTADGVNRGFLRSHEALSVQRYRPQTDGLSYHQGDISVEWWSE